jgi:tellurite resistance protein
MDAHVDAMVKSLVAVAWADGRMDNEERDVLDALSSAFQLSAEDTKVMRAYAQTPRTMNDLPLAQLSDADRRQVLQHAVIITFVDGEQSDKERAIIHELTQKLGIGDAEAAEIIKGAEKRAQRLIALR